MGVPVERTLSVWSRADFYIAVSLLVFTLAHPSRILEEHLAALGVSISIQRMAFAVNLLFLAVIAFDRCRLGKYHKRLFFLFGVTAAYMALLGLTGVYAQSDVYTTKTAVRHLSIGLMMVIVVGGRRLSLELLLDAVMGLGLFFAVLAVGQFLAVQLGVLVLKPYTWTTYGAGTVQMLGFGGYASDIYAGGIYRVSSYWSEPARFAQFIVIPFFLAIRRYKLSPSGGYVFAVGVLGLALILTFSLATFFAILTAVGSVSVLRIGGARVRHRARMVMLAVILIVGIGTTQLFRIANSEGYDSGHVLGKGITGSLTERADRLGRAFEALDSSFFGDPSIRDRWRRNPSAFGLLIIYGGVPLAVLALLYSGVVVGGAFLRLRSKSTYSFLYVGFVAYFIAFNWYGDYYETAYLFNLVLVAAALNQELQPSANRNSTPSIPLVGS
jgi:hypothetical protein